MVATGQEMFRGKILFKVGEKSGNSSLSQGKVKSLKEVRKKWNFKSAILLLILFCTLYFYYFLTSKYFNLYILQTWIMLYYKNIVHEIEWQADVWF